MPETVENYWGTEFPNLSDSAPVILLKEQARKLTEVTKGKVKGEVKVSTEEGTAWASLYAGVPQVGDYQFKILSIAHPVVSDPSDPFPITVGDSFDFKHGTVPDMQSFDSYLRRLLSSEPVRIAIANLIKYSDTHANYGEYGEVDNPAEVG